MGLFIRRDGDETPAYQPVVRPYNHPRAITASARQLSLGDKTEIESMKKRRKAAQWQDDAWEYYDIVGELWSAANMISNVISRIRIYPAYIESRDSAPKRIQDEESIPPEIAEITQDAMSSLESGTGGIPALLRDFALNFFVAGECYLVKSPEKPYSGTPETWTIHSTSELIAHKTRDSEWALKTTRDASQDEYVPISPRSHYVARMWRQHPRYSNEADSSIKAVIDKLEELLLYDRTARTISRSRLNAGLLFVPDSIAASLGTDGTLMDDETMAPLNDDEADSFEDDLMNALLTPIEDETSATSIVPIILRGPESAGDKIRHFSFERNMDNMFSNRADRALERMIAGLDLPKEAVTGLAELKYANSIQVEENLYKAHIEPLVLSLCDNLTAVFLKPILRSHGYTDEQIQNITMWYDPSAITAKPDRASAASEGYDKKIISASAWRRAHDFSESDAPTSEETIERLALERGVLNESVTDMALRSIAPEMVEEMQTRLRAESPTSIDDIMDEEEPPENLIEP